MPSIAFPPYFYFRLSVAHDTARKKFSLFIKFEWATVCLSVQSAGIPEITQPNYICILLCLCLGSPLAALRCYVLPVLYIIGKTKATQVGRRLLKVTHQGQHRIGSESETCDCLGIISQRRGGTSFGFIACIAYRCGLLLPMSHVSWSVCLRVWRTQVAFQNG